jgi:hypothetical protein
MRWFDVYDDVLRLGRYLVEVFGYDGHHLQAFYEKPWRYDDEYEQMCESEQRHLESCRGPKPF